MVRYWVAPLVGAWIEIVIDQQTWITCWSLPLWERGLKYVGITKSHDCPVVAPLVGAWIEIVKNIMDIAGNVVAPLVGAWIEI